MLKLNLATIDITGRRVAFPVLVHIHHPVQCNPRAIHLSSERKAIRIHPEQRGGQWTADLPLPTCRRPSSAFSYPRSL